MLNHYIPNDRRLAIALKEPFPERQYGCALFLDIVGFTALSDAMASTFGQDKGCEVLTATVNRIFDALIDVIDSWGGSVISFAGDSITAWFNNDHGKAAVAAGLSMQDTMEMIDLVDQIGEYLRPISLKITVVGGEVKRFLIGSQDLQYYDVMAGGLIDRIAIGESLCDPSEVLIDRPVVEALGTSLTISAWKDGFATGISLQVEPTDQRPDSVTDVSFLPDDLRAWLLPAVYDYETSGNAQFLAEFRRIAAVFGSFEGIDYDALNGREQLDKFIRNCLKIVARHGGYIFDISIGEKGSYFMAIFGAPHSKGDDIRRAVSAAEELRHANVCRIGINSGRVYAGLYAGQSRSVYRVAGKTVNLAARLMAEALPGQVLLSSDVSNCLGRLFTFNSLQPIMVKGLHEPVPVCELIAVKTSTTTLNASSSSHQTPMIGRLRELGILSSALKNAKLGNGSLVGLSAEAGMGKSRLIQEAILRGLAAGFSSHTGECQPFGTGIAYLPWQSVMNNLLRISSKDSVSQRRERVTEFVRNTVPEKVLMAPLMERVLNLPMDDNDITRGMPSSMRKQITEELLVDIIGRHSGTEPLLIILEDVHWIDSLSRELLAVLAERVTTMPVLVVLAYRQLEDLRGLPDLHEVRLDEFTPVEAEDFINKLAVAMKCPPPPRELTDTIIEKANGNPFYIEELMRYIHEQGASGKELPPNLESLILARIDSLPQLQQLTIKVASIIGRKFSLKLLTKAFGDSTGICTKVDELIHIQQMGLVIEDPAEKEQTFLFRHAIVRDVAYGMLSHLLRESLHEQLALYLEQSETTNPPVELLAYHYSLSKNEIKEAKYRQLAAEVAIRISAHSDGLANVRRALEIVADQPEGYERLVKELELELLLGTILLIVEGQGSTLAKQVYDRAREHAKLIPKGPLLGRAIFGMWTYYLFQGDMEPTEELAEEALALAYATSEPGVKVMAHLALAQTHMWTGKWHQCLEHYHHVVENYDPDQHHQYIIHYAQNPRYTATHSGFMALWALGKPILAIDIVEQAIAEAATHDHALTTTIAVGCRPFLAFLNRTHDVLKASVDEFVHHSHRAGNPFYMAFSLAFKGYAEVLDGEKNSGLDLLIEQDATMRSLGSNLIEPVVTSMLGEAFLATGGYREGIGLIEARMRTYVRQGKVSWMSDHLRLRAELLLATDSGAKEEIISLLTKARSLAFESNAISMELRAALSLSSLLRQQGQEDFANQTLASTVVRFREGLDLPDLQAAHFQLNLPITP